MLCGKLVLAYFVDLESVGILFVCIVVCMYMCVPTGVLVCTVSLSLSLSPYRSCVMALGADGAADAGCECCRSGSCR